VNGVALAGAGRPPVNGGLRATRGLQNAYGDAEADARDVENA
jgi:hypothetical protein